MERVVWQKHKNKEILLGDYSNIKSQEEYVKIIRSDQIITGIGFESDQSLENWRIKDPKGTIYVDVETSENNDMDSTQNLLPRH